MVRRINKSLLDTSYSLTTLEVIIAISNNIYVGTLVIELITITKDKWFYTCFFNSCKSDL